MNLILVDSGEPRQNWKPREARTVHLKEVLRVPVGGSFWVGLRGGPRGQARLERWARDGSAEVLIDWEGQPTPLRPVILMVGLPRPQTARRILHDAAVFGISRLILFQSERGEPGYATSQLWCSGEWERHLRLGAEQAFVTTLPSVSHADSLAAAVGQVQADCAGWSWLAPDVYEGERPLTAALAGSTPAGVLLGIGAERGWSPGERALLREGGFELVSMGDRVLRTETACVVGLSLSLAALGYL